MPKPPIEEVVVSDFLRHRPSRRDRRRRRACGRQCSRVGRSSTEWDRRPRRRSWSRPLDLPSGPDVDAGGKEPLVDARLPRSGSDPLAINDDSDRNHAEAFAISASANSSPMEPGGTELVT